MQGLSVHTQNSCNYSLSRPFSWLAQQTWNRGRTGTRPLLAPRQVTPHPQSQTSRFPAPATTLCLLATTLWFHKRRTRDWPKSCHSKRPPPTTFPTARNDGASTRATTSTWSVPHLGATHWVSAQTLQHFFIGTDVLLLCTNPKLNVYTSLSFPLCLPPSFTLFFSLRSSNREAWETFLHIGMSSLPQPLCWWMQGTHTHTKIYQQGFQGKKCECETMTLNAILKHKNFPLEALTILCVICLLSHNFFFHFILLDFYLPHWNKWCCVFASVTTL